MKSNRADFKQIIALLERIAYQTSVQFNRMEIQEYLAVVAYNHRERKPKPQPKPKPHKDPNDYNDYGNYRSESQ